MCSKSKTPSIVAATDIAIADEQQSATVWCRSLPVLTNLQKIMMIQQVLDTEIRPMLIADGGDVQLHDVDGDRSWSSSREPAACASSTATLKHAIEAKLKDLYYRPSPFKKWMG
jgi:NifU-like protein